MILIKKLILILGKIFKARFYFRSPPKKKLVVFDGHSIEQLMHVLDEEEYIVLETRFDRINKFYINKNIFLKTIKNKNNNFLNSYLLAVLDEINPKVVFTFIDNSFRFSEFSEIRKKNYRFVALQNGARYEHKIINQIHKKKIDNLNFKKFNISYFFCFGSYEISDYKKCNQNIDNFYRVGSLKLSNYLKEKKQKIKNKDYDILLISDANCWDKILDKLNLPIQRAIIDLIKYTIKFSKKYKYKIKIAARSFKNDFEDEKEFYKKFLNKEEFNFLLENIFFRSKNYNTYRIMEKSELVIGTMSTMLRENLAIGGKTLACNFTQSKIFDFPLKGKCFLNQNRYESFEKRARNILKISKKTFYNNISRDPKYVIDNLNTDRLVRTKLRKMLEK